MKHVHRLVLLGSLLAGCGNYSNEDIEFQLALPESADLDAKLPGQALTVDDAAEYYTTTRSLLKLSNEIKDSVIGLVDRVRMYPATTRHPGLRVWGPFPHEKYRDWLMRVSIRKISDGAVAPAPRFEFSFDLRRSGGGENDWIRLMWGTYAAAADRRTGEIGIDTAPARANGFPVDDPDDPDDLNDVETLMLTYETHAFPVVLDMAVTNVASSTKPAGAATFSYREQSDGSGTAAFGFEVALAPWIERMELRTRWNDTGGGRGDSRVLKGTLSGSAGTDCWSPDTRATFVVRTIPDDKQPNRGDRATCAFGDP